MENLQDKIQNIDPNNINESDIGMIESTIQELDKGTIRVAKYELKHFATKCLLIRSPG